MRVNNVQGRQAKGDEIVEEYTEEERRPRRGLLVAVIVAAMVLLLCVCGAVAIGAGVFLTDRAAQGFSLGNLEDMKLPGIRETVGVRRNDVFVVDTPVEVEIENDVGSVEVLGTSGSEVRVEAEIIGYGRSMARAGQIADDIEIRIERVSDSQMRLVARNPRNLPSLSGAKVSFVVEVPYECALNVTQDVGSVGVQDLQGSVSISLDVGDVDVENLSLDGDSEIKVDVGDIRISLAEGSAFELDASTDVGSIDSDLQVRGGVKDRSVPGEKLSGNVGDDPEHRLELETDTGTITITEVR